MIDSLCEIVVGTKFFFHLTDGVLKVDIYLAKKRSSLLTHFRKKFSKIFFKEVAVQYIVQKIGVFSGYFFFIGLKKLSSNQIKD